MKRWSWSAVVLVVGCAGKTTEPPIATDSAIAEETIVEASIAETIEDTTEEGIGPETDSTLDASDGDVGASDALDAADASPCTKPGSVTASAGEVVQIGTGASWTSLEAAIDSDDVWARSTVTAGTSSMTLWARKFGITVPASAKITGVRVAIERHKSGTPPMIESTFKIFDGVALSSEHRGASWPLVDAVAMYGSATDTWGLPLTPTSVASDMFGPQLVVTTPGGASAAVDAIGLTVYYEISDCTD